MSEAPEHNDWPSSSSTPHIDDELPKVLLKLAFHSSTILDLRQQLADRGNPLLVESAELHLRPPFFCGFGPNCQTPFFVGPSWYIKPSFFNRLI